MIVIPWSAIQIARDILVALIAVAACWVFSVFVRFGDTLDSKSEWRFFGGMFFVAMILLLFRWRVIVVL